MEGTKQESSNLTVRMKIFQNMSSYEEMVNPDLSLQDTDIFAINSPNKKNDLVFFLTKHNFMGNVTTPHVSQIILEVLTNIHNIYFRNFYQYFNILGFEIGSSFSSFQVFSKFHFTHNAMFL